MYPTTMTEELLRQPDYFFSLLPPPHPFFPSSTLFSCRYPHSQLYPLSSIRIHHVSCVSTFPLASPPCPSKSPPSPPPDSGRPQRVPANLWSAQFCHTRAVLSELPGPWRPMRFLLEIRYDFGDQASCMFAQCKNIAYLHLSESQGLAFS
jgi:hypothetical protein